MDLGRLTGINPWGYALTLLPGEARAPVRLYADAQLLRGMDAKVLEQIANVARLPGLVGASMTMPDAHWGYGFPIGGVAAFDAERGGIVSAGGVGFDISRRIPAGVGEEGRLRFSMDELDDMLRGGAAWAVNRGFGIPEDLEYIEEG